MKFLSTTVATVIITVVICVASIIIYLEPLLSDIFRRDTQTAVKTSASQISYYLDEISTYSKDISFQPTIQNVYTTSHPHNTYAYYRLVMDAEDYLDQFVVLHDNLIWNILLLDPNGAPLETVSRYGNILKSELYKPYLSQDVSSGFTVPNQISMNLDQEKLDVVAYICNINSSSVPDTYLGKLVIFIKYKELIRPLQEFGDTCSLFLYNEQSQPLYPAGSTISRNDILYHDAAFQYNGTLHRTRDSYIFEADPGNTGWSLIGITPDQIARSGVFNIIRILFIIMILCSLLSILAVYITTNQLTKPLNSLIHAMKRVSEGERNVYVEIHSKDEIEELAQVFNHMIQDINTYTNELLYRDKKEFEMTLQMLMYQINPHFIYNTLNCIICLARKQKSSTIIDLTRVFISLLQHTLKTMPDTFTTVENEMAYTNNYVSILQYSYENVAPIVWNIEPGLLSCGIPHLILYPIVENSIFHGGLTENRPSSVSVSITTENDHVNICVSDNGHGMDHNTLMYLQSILNGNLSQKEHIGLVNVNNRLRLLYGEYAKLQIESRKGIGTSVSFLIEYKKLT
ncbi:MAG: histidine kinase [Eubacteriales bacterium]|nr:histidine kinase [Eubacteriales bacterium]